MLTQFGKECRKIRIDCGEILRDMADKLNVTSAYLSAVETGKRNVPEQWPDVIAQLYGLNEAEKEELRKKAINSQTSIRLEVNKMEDNQRDLAVAFARKLETLDKSKISKIMDILE